MIKSKLFLAAVGLTVATFTITTSSLATPNSDLSNAGVFNLVADTAAKICGEVPDSGWNVDSSASASIDLPLGEFFKKLFDARATGNAGVSGGKYAGPLRNQLMDVRRDTQDCKKVVADQLLQYVRQTQKTENVPENKRVQVGSMRLVPNVVRYPKQSAEEFAAKFVQLIDTGKYYQAYQNLEQSIRAMQSREAFAENLRAVGSQCYPARSRSEIVSQGRMIPASQSIFRRDEYGYSFRTRFKDGDSSKGTDPDEVVGVVLSDSGVWQVMEFTSNCFTKHNSIQ